MYNYINLFRELRAAGLPVVGTRDGEPPADYSRELTVEEQATEASVLAAHDPNAPTLEQAGEALATASKSEFRGLLPNWATWTPQQGRDYVTGAVLTGQSKAEVDAWIDTNVTTLATARTALKLLAGAILDLRTITAIMAGAVLLLRDIAVRKVD